MISCFVPRLSTLNYWFFLNEYEYFENSCTESYQPPSKDCILSQCSHFVEEAAKSLFCDLVTKLLDGPQAPVKAWYFAEYLLKTHDFFLPLRTETARRDACAVDGSAESFSPSDISPASDPELKSVSTMFAGVDPSPNSQFQHLFGNLDRLNRQGANSSAIAADVHNLLTTIWAHVRSSSPTDLSEKIQFGALEVLMRTLHAHCRDFAITRKVLYIVFQILESCPNQRHILMQIAHVERETGESLLRYLVKFISSGPSSAAGADAAASIPDIAACALRCVKSAVSCSIPYHSLSDFPNSGCYGSPKMDSMLTAKVLQNILIAIQDEVASESLEFLHNAANHLDQAASADLLQMREYAILFHQCSFVTLSLGTI